MTERITSARNPRVLALKQLKTRADRLQANICLIEGEKPIREAMAIPGLLKSLWLSDGAGTKERAVCDRAECPVYSVPDSVLMAISSRRTPQGILAEAALPQPPQENGLGERIIALDRVQDPGNTGTILRTAAAAGFTGALLSEETVDPYSPKALQASAGSVFNLPVLVADIADILGRLGKQGYSIITTELNGDPFFNRRNIAERFALVIGNEGNGVSAPLINIATHRLALPMTGRVDSLNAAVAAGIMIYDLCFGKTRS